MCEFVQSVYIFHSHDTLSYMEDLKKFLGTDHGSINFSYFIHGSRNPEQELGERDCKKAKSIIMEVGTVGVIVMKEGSTCSIG